MTADTAGILAAGAAAVALVGGFLGWVVKLSIKSEFASLTKDFATTNYVDEKVSVHEQIHHHGRGGK